MCHTRGYSSSELITRLFMTSTLTLFLCDLYVDAVSLYANSVVTEVTSETFVHFYVTPVLKGAYDFMCHTTGYSSTNSTNLTA